MSLEYYCHRKFLWCICYKCIIAEAQVVCTKKGLPVDATEHVLEFLDHAIFKPSHSSAAATNTPAIAATATTTTTTTPTPTTTTTNTTATAAAAATTAA
jgi:hypothetical protein